MVSLLTHTVAYSTRPSLSPKTKNGKKPANQKVFLSFDQLSQRGKISDLILENKLVVN